MQVTNRKPLTDQQSIALAQKIILVSYNKNKAVALSEYDLASRISADYN